MCNYLLISSVNRFSNCQNNKDNLIYKQRSLSQLSLVQIQSYQSLQNMKIMAVAPQLFTLNDGRINMLYPSYVVAALQITVKLRSRFWLSYIKHCYYGKNMLKNNQQNYSNETIFLDFLKFTADLMGYFRLGQVR